MPNPTLAELGLQGGPAQVTSPAGGGLFQPMETSVQILGKAYLIYGPSGIGKTTLAFTLSPKGEGKRYVWNTEGGLSVVKDKPALVADITQYSQIVQLRAQMYQLVKAGDVVIADSVTEWLRLNTIAALEYPVKRNYNEVPILQDWGLIIERMRDGMRDLRNLRNKGVDVILICGEKYDKDENLGTFIGGPSLSGQLATEVQYLVDEVYHMQSVPGPQGERRVFHTTPHLFWGAKTRSGLPPIVECPKGEQTLDKYFR